LDIGKFVESDAGAAVLGGPLVSVGLLLPRPDNHRAAPWRATAL